MNSYNESIPSSINRIEDVVEGVLDFVEKSGGVSEDSIKFDLKVILNELLLNAVRHGNKEDTAKFVKVTADIANDEVRLTVQDEGGGFDFESLLNGQYDDFCCDICDQRECGRGLRIVSGLSDGLSFGLGGTKAVAVKKLR